MGVMEETFLELIKDYRIEIYTDTFPKYSIISKDEKYLVYPGITRLSMFETEDLLIDDDNIYQIFAEKFNVSNDVIEFYLKSFLLKYFKFDCDIRRGFRSIFNSNIINLKNENKKTKYKNYPTPNSIYKHYKGGLYKVITLAKYKEEDSYATNEGIIEKDMVVYQSLHFGSFHIRSLISWNQQVIPIDKNDKRDICPRFELIN